MMQARKFKYNVIGSETIRRYLLNAVYETEELFLKTCDSRGVGGIRDESIESIAENIDSFEQFTTQIGSLHVKRCDPALA
ncbi:hypothetical protein RB195_014440 [Necator americanus]|uniref:Uncharacterized protein n=1 Tax=Necator americanus TaxID=51031 RepID=A0ABR1E041_NECAM